MTLFTQISVQKPKRILPFSTYDPNNHLPFYFGTFDTEFWAEAQYDTMNFHNLPKTLSTAQKTLDMIHMDSKFFQNSLFLIHYSESSERKTHMMFPTWQMVQNLHNSKHMKQFIDIEHKALSIISKWYYTKEKSSQKKNTELIMGHIKIDVQLGLRILTNPEIFKTSNTKVYFFTKKDLDACIHLFKSLVRIKVKNDNFVKMWKKKKFVAWDDLKMSSR